MTFPFRVHGGSLNPCIGETALLDIEFLVNVLPKADFIIAAAANAYPSGMHKSLQGYQ
jgi:hypothetical protein